MGLGFPISLLSMLCWDSYFDITSFKSAKEPTFSIRFNALYRTKNLFFNTALENDKFFTEADSEDNENDGILMKNKMENFCLFISPMT